MYLEKLKYLFIYFFFCDDNYFSNIYVITNQYTNSYIYIYIYIYS